MSHISRIKTKIVEKKFLLSALADLNYSFEEGDLEVHGYFNKSERVEIKINLGQHFDIGFRKKGAIYEVVADWEGIRSINKTKFIHQVSQRYAYHAAREVLEQQGFSLVEEQYNKNGQIRLVLRRMN